MNITGDPRTAADYFVDELSRFHLGFLTTEQANPRTATLGETARQDLSEALSTLIDVDQEMIAKVVELAGSPQVQLLASALGDAVGSDGRIFFAGCGASGRLSVQLEAMWRRMCREQGLASGQAETCTAVISGGDLAVVRSIEGFEDYESFGRQQVADLDVRSGDVFVTLGEGGIAYSTIGMALEAMDRGAQTFFLHCNSRADMAERLDRCRRLFSRRELVSIQADLEPMAVAGSTRMQATSMELILVGMALEEAIAEARGGGAGTSLLRSITALANDLDGPETRSAIVSIVEAEAETYRSGGLVTYFADRYLIDVFADTTERTPTFALPPFARVDHPEDTPSLAFAKHRSLPTREAWTDLLQREPRGLSWTADTFRALGAPESLVSAPPDVSGQACLQYAVGNETVTDRSVRRPALALPLEVGLDSGPLPENAAGAFDRVHAFAVPMGLAPSPLDVAGHLACKLVVNYVSTLGAARLGRLVGNRMIYVLPSNHKLVDRCIRIVADLGRTDYRSAAHLVFEEMARSDSEAGTSPVPAALRRLGVDLP